MIDSTSIAQELARLVGGGGEWVEEPLFVIDGKPLGITKRWVPRSPNPWPAGYVD